ncbi:MAG: DUF4136 domain-containing protein [Bacteroidales bacterium]|nr:DUF4136 domain-containing protein [Bacteroidales bacterium]
MKRKLFSLVLLTSLGLLWGCYPDGPEYVDELDIVYSNYDPGFDFESKGTYSIPDKIVKITGDEDADIEYVNNIYAQPTLAQIEKNMAALGWTKVAQDQNPDTHLFPAAWTSTTIVVSGGWGGYWCYWDPYYCGGYGWYYPYPVYSSYTTGTFLMTMVDPNYESTDGSRLAVWTSAINGLYQGTYNASRVNNAIDQAFEQSSYLKTN